MAKGELLNEVSKLTADAVVKKQDAAKLNFPKLAAQIKGMAALGNSELRVPLHQMNEYDKKLLQEEGFAVSLQDVVRNPYDYKSEIFDKSQKKEWVIRW